MNSFLSLPLSPHLLLTSPHSGIWTAPSHITLRWLYLKVTGRLIGKPFLNSYPPSHRCVASEICQTSTFWNELSLWHLWIMVPPNSSVLSDRTLSFYSCSSWHFLKSHRLFWESNKHTYTHPFVGPIKVWKCQVNYLCSLLSFLVILTTLIFKIMQFGQFSHLSLQPWSLYQFHTCILSCLIDTPQGPQTHLPSISWFTLAYFCWWLGDISVVVQTRKLAVIIKPSDFPKPVPRPIRHQVLLIFPLPHGHSSLLHPSGTTSVWLHPHNWSPYLQAAPSTHTTPPLWYRDLELTDSRSGTWQGSCRGGPVQPTLSLSVSVTSGEWLYSIYLNISDEEKLTSSLNRSFTSGQFQSQKVSPLH